MSGNEIELPYFPSESLRDFFAATCPNDLAKCNVPEDAERIAGPTPQRDDFRAFLAWNNRVEAYLRYAYADAMLAERNTDRIPNDIIDKTPREWWLVMDGEKPVAVRDCQLQPDSQYQPRVHVREVLP